ncbi:MAG: hypothetical protein LKI59_07445 [Bacteroidales bacterium]|jgi:hypothetical protein|nr:hypothetical protein [Bacteroidales bacterium]
MTHYKIAYIIDENLFLAYKRLSYYLLNKKEPNNNVTTINNNLFPFSKVLLSKNRLLNRLFRLEPKCIARLSNDLFITSFLHKTLVFNIVTREIRELMISREGFSDTLNFCSDGQFVYWGDYGSNVNHKDVNIYRIGQDLKVDIIYKFASGTIRHIHNIIFDKENDRFWIFAGDNEEVAGIYLANKTWSEIEPVFIGEQRYRTVVGFPYENGLIYATDSVEKNNYIYIITEDGKESILTEINGSCIYGTETKDYFVFSTTVESPEGNGIKAILSTKLGNGIKSHYVHLIVVNKKDLSVKIVRKYKKDIWPMKLLQYGAITFPGGQEFSNKLWYYPVACKGVDGKNIMIDLDELS